MHVIVISRSDGQRPQEPVVLRQFKKRAAVQTRFSTSPFPYSLLEWGVTAALLGLERLVRRFVCASFR
jgi:hypothetical protein